MKPTPEQARQILHKADVLCPADGAQRAVAQLAADINASLHDSHPLVLCVMRGGVVFAGQLLPLLTFPLELDYIDATRYADTTQGGTLTLRAMPRSEVRSRTVLLIDDVLDEGHTLAALRAELLARGAHRVLIAVFCEKNTGQAKPVAADFRGLMLPNRYLFGFGMDVHGYWRNLPAVYAVKD